jgi:hypothetical protein
MVLMECLIEKLLCKYLLTVRVHIDTFCPTPNTIVVCPNSIVVAVRNGINNLASDY